MLRPIQTATGIDDRPNLVVGSMFPKRLLEIARVFAPTCPLFAGDVNVKNTQYILRLHIDII